MSRWTAGLLRNSVWGTDSEESSGLPCPPPECLPPECDKPAKKLKPTSPSACRFSSYRPAFGARAAMLKGHMKLAHPEPNPKIRRQVSEKLEEVRCTEQFVALQAL